MSSPGTYSRCWTNSTDCPKVGLLCMPVRNPSTTCRARKSSCEMRAIVLGSRNRFGSSSLRRCMAPVLVRGKPTDGRPWACSCGEDLLEPLVGGEIAFLVRRLVEQLLDHHVRGHALGRGREVRQNTVPQHRVG